MNALAIPRPSGSAPSVVTVTEGPDIVNVGECKAGADTDGEHLSLRFERSPRAISSAIGPACVRPQSSERPASRQADPQQSAPKGWRRQALDRSNGLA
jgi:hypothetical protein